MNREIEFHDSTLTKVLIEGSNVIICLDKVYIHQSDGTPGLDKGTGWEQTINIKLSEAHVDKMPGDLPNDLDTGQITVDGATSQNMMKLPFSYNGEIEIVLFTMYGHELRVKCKKIQTQEVGEAIFLENFPGD